jgi:Flp pilus assembly protein TadD
VLEVGTRERRIAVSVLSSSRGTGAECDPCDNLGIPLEELGRLAEAEQAFRRALELQPDDPDLYTSLGESLQARNRHREAIEALLFALVELCERLVCP